jgi:cell division protein FtsA
MYATSVGLVLAGFKSLDERENLYRLRKENVSNNTQKIQAKPVKTEFGPNIFSSIGKKLKDIITNDIHDDNNY